ncbi:hypothetical protein ACFOWM_11585 [Ferruginibacter yonginensis]|uniref:Uncharacterized protein n=1 Tax=Ferruginibacter yonginensis TaxID=1310416 RepID=A0ABV8QTA8_9BACT
MLLTTFTVCCNLLILAQNNLPVFKDAVASKRTKFYTTLVNSIEKNIQLPITNEDAWLNCFNNINLIKYKADVVKQKLDNIANNIQVASPHFWRSFLELINSDYPNQYKKAVTYIYNNSKDDVTLKAMALHYLMQHADSNNLHKWINEITILLKANKEEVVLQELLYNLENQLQPKNITAISSFFDTNYLPKHLLVFSLQRKNRNYPGIVIVRKPDGSFLKHDDNTFFSVPQLARSASNMPSYISLGNTPQGIFKLTGFDTSKSFFIGPSTNIQLSMPYEYCKVTINNQLVDTTWTLEQYCNLLPKPLQQYHPLYGSYFAGKAGRNEIIAHGTTIDPSYYKNETYYPLTPTAGCLATTEFWGNTTGQIQQSDQLLLTQAIQKAGGPKGYLIVIELDDEQRAVELKDVKQYLH